jgi:hypothetical protein
LAAIYFLAGTVTRNAKVVYGLAACFYPVFIAFALLLKRLPRPLRAFFAPFGLDISPVGNPWDKSPDFLNHLVVSYSLTAYANRAWVIIMAGILLLIVYFRWAIEPLKKRSEHFTQLTLSEKPGRITYSLESVPAYAFLDLPNESPARARVTLPNVIASRGPAATLAQIIAAAGVEFRLLRAERGLMILVPLAIFLSFLSVPFSRIASEISYSVTFATNTANMLLLFLACVIVFYMGEAMHRDRELNIEPVVWSTPAANSVLLISKWLAMTSLSVSLLIVGGLTTIAVQFMRGHTPVDLSAYLIIDGVVLLPGIIFMTASVLVLNVLLRSKYLTYVVAVGTGAGLIYLYNVGYNHWLYNPLLYRIWTYGNLTSGTILSYRLYCLALAAGLLALAHVFFERKSA